MQSEKVHLTKKQEGSGNMRTIVKASIFRLIQKELPGYDAYMAQVKYRLIPNVW